MRVENVEQPEQYIEAILAKVKKHHLERSYEIQGWVDHVQFLDILARKSGGLLREGEPDIDGVAKMVLRDFTRGKIPWFTPLPSLEHSDQQAKARSNTTKMQIDHDETPSNSSSFNIRGQIGEQEEGFEGFSPPAQGLPDAVAIR